MKKILSMLLVIATMLTVCMSLVACGGPKPKLDLDKAKENLKDKGYCVEIIDEEEDIVYAAGYAGYAIEVILLAEDRSREDSICIMKFKTSKDARMYYKNITSLQKLHEYILKKFGRDMDDAEKDLLEEMIERENVKGYWGKYVWFGTKDAIKDTQG